MSYCFFLPTTVTAEMRGGIFTEGPQISASRAGWHEQAASVEQLSSPIALAEADIVYLQGTW